jgi:hypothetical protein
MKVALNNKIPKLIQSNDNKYACSSKCCLNKQISHEKLLCDLVDLPCRYNHTYVLTENDFYIFKI